MLRSALIPLTAALLSPGITHAAQPPPTAPPAVVALGDSIASGEGAGDYLDSPNPDCHRSRRAELATAQINGAEYINLACSGAHTANIGDTGQGAQRPQLEQLRDVAGGYRISLVLITVGANDLGFSGVATRCATGYMLTGRSCAAQESADLAPKLDALRPQLDRVLAGVRDVLAQTHQDDARIVLQSYPNPLATANAYDTRLGRFAHGCPFHDEDAAWARNGFVPAMGKVIKDAARAAAVEYLDLSGAMDGKEACSTGDSPKWTHGITLRLMGASAPEGYADVSEKRAAELLAQGGTEGLISPESLHPNALGHAALGSCLAQFYAQRGNGYCQPNGDGLKFMPIPFEQG